MCIIRWLPQDSALHRHMHPDSWQWTILEHLLAGIYDTLQGANWQRAGNPDAPRPQQLPRPGVADADEPEKKPKRETIPLDQIHSVLARRRQEAQQAAAIPVPAELPAAPLKRRRLTADEVRIVRRMADAGAPVADIASGLRVPVESIDRLLRGETYRHIE
ncbi:hypothetical protein GS532_23810 [Rhodococcus hoagii]|nr:hypothetical protein [Prescottella equi]MBM4686665.1 hypothetical protein [Prescottella equi]